jgi:hypothetical protein
MSALGQAALELASLGLCIFPVRPSGKEPAVYNGFKRATTDPNIIAGWWRGNPDCNIGVRCGQPSGILVVDVDGEIGEDNLDKLESEHGALPLTIEGITRQGRHLYYQWPGRPVPCSVGKIAAKIDIRADSGYVVAPPSVHPEGPRYLWRANGADAFAPPPEWLVKAALGPTTRGGKPAAKPAEAWHELIKGVPEGYRDNTIAQLAGYLLCRRVDPVMALTLLQSWNRTSCTPPLPDEDIARIVNSIASKEVRRRAGFGR